MRTPPNRHPPSGTHAGRRCRAIAGFFVSNLHSLGGGGGVAFFPPQTAPKPPHDSQTNESKGHGLLPSFAGVTEPRPVRNIRETPSAPLASATSHQRSSTDVQGDGVFNA